MPWSGSSTVPLPVANASALDGLTVPDGRLIQIQDLPTLAYYSALAGTRKVVPAYLHPDNGTYTLATSLAANELDQVVTVTNFVADTSQHGISVGGNTYGGTVTGATQEAVLAALDALVVLGAEAGYSGTVSGTGAEAVLTVSPGCNLLAGAETAVAVTLPTGWTLTLDGTVVTQAPIVDGVLTLDSVGAGGTCDLKYALPTPDLDADWIVLVAQHGWTDDAALADSAANRLHMALRLAYGNQVALWAAASPTALWSALWLATGNATSLGPNAQPLGDYWEVIGMQKGTGNNHLGSTRRLAGPATSVIGNLVGARRAIWSTVVEANAMTYHSAEGTVLEVTAAHIFYQ